MDILIDLRAKNPVYDGSADSMAEIFYPVVLLPKWIPAEATHERERSIGISFMMKRPEGTPHPLALKPWVTTYNDFMREMRKRYNRASEEYIFEEWNYFMSTFLPTKPGLPCTPSDDVVDYAFKMGSKFQPPLRKYLYGKSPTGFGILRGRDLSSCSETLMREVDPWFGKRSWVDEIVHNIIVQEHQTIPHRLNQNPYRCWSHEFPEMLQGVIVQVKSYNKVTKKYDDVLKPGRIVAFADDDINHSPTYRVSLFNDIDPLANKEYHDITVLEYHPARIRFRNIYPDEVSGLDDKHDAAKVIADAREKRMVEEQNKKKAKEDAKLLRDQLRDQQKAAKATAAAAKKAAREAAALEREIAPKKKQKAKAALKAVVPNDADIEEEKEEKDAPALGNAPVEAAPAIVPMPVAGSTVPIAPAKIRQRSKSKPAVALEAKIPNDADIEEEKEEKDAPALGNAPVEAVPAIVPMPVAGSTAPIAPAKIRQRSEPKAAVALEAGVSDRPQVGKI